MKRIASHPQESQTASSRFVIPCVLAALGAVLFLLPPDAHAFGCYSKACERARARSASVQKSGKVAVVEKSFKRGRAGNIGHWRGRVAGLGKTKLFLKIHSGGKLIATRFIGELNLEPHDGAILFSFRSVVPRAKSWTWDIAAVTA